MNSQEIRQQFIDFFVSKQHTYASPSPVVPQNDPTLLFINAGMNQFKDVFLDQGSRPYTRAVNSQICIRVSGKHNDLEDVGKDTTHLTLFEMLGNWSFGDFYKKEAIMWAWELFTDIYKLPKEKLYASIYKTDDESGQLWKNHTDIDPSHILKFDEKDNFWEMGQTGPCGPCSEIHIDLGPDACDKQGVDHKCEVNGKCNRYVELWNLVFIQYNRKEDGSLEELPNKHVDTGAGLERIVATLQNTTSVYRTDLFEPLIKTIETISGTPYQDSQDGMPHRVIADHIRTLTFSIADNVRPSNEGRGYVLRRLLRRALRYAKQLGINKPFLYQLVDPLVEKMGSHFENIKIRKDYIKDLIKAEEDSFLKTLESGIQKFNDITKSTTHQISGTDAFKLYDTYGFPVDLTCLMAEEANLTVDIEAFSVALQKQKDLSRSAKKIATFDANKKAPKGGEARIVESDTEIKQMAMHHSATHLLQAALRDVLGDHVTQAGSLVDLDRLRFDFTHHKSLTVEELKKIEALIHQKIKEAIPITCIETSLDVAQEMGAMALFGEKYEDTVRVVKINNFSMELCGGHHSKNTAEIESFKILTESAISAGTRRIEAIVGNNNIKNHIDKKKSKQCKLIEKKQIQLKQLQSQLESLGETVTISQHTDLMNQSLEQLITLEQKQVSHIKKLQKQLQKTQSQASSEQTKDLTKHIQDIPNTPYKIIKHLFSNYDIPMLRQVADQLTNQTPNLITVLASTHQNKGFFIVKLGKDININDFQASEIIKTLTKITGGGGGGKATMAQAGGADPNKLQAALDSLTL